MVKIEQGVFVYLYVFRNVYLHTVITTNEKEVMDLKENKGRFEERKGKREMIELYYYLKKSLLF